MATKKDEDIEKEYAELRLWYALENPEIKQLFQDWVPFHLKGFVTFAYKTGWRVSEIKNLAWNQVDLDQGIMRIEGDQTKNNEARSAYLDAELREVFHEQWERKKADAKLTPYVFNGANGLDMIKDFRRA